MSKKCHPSKEGVDCHTCKLACTVLKRTPECQISDIFNGQDFEGIFDAFKDEEK